LQTNQPIDQQMGQQESQNRGAPPESDDEDDAKGSTALQYDEGYLEKRTDVPSSQTTIVRSAAINVAPVSTVENGQQGQDPAPLVLSNKPPVFLRPQGVDVPGSQRPPVTTNVPRGVSRREMIGDLIANARKAKAAEQSTSSATQDVENSDAVQDVGSSQTANKRKTTEDENVPRKKAKRPKADAIS
jgi:hypothetical protein